MGPKIDNSKKKPSKKRDHWSLGLLTSMKDPTLIVLENELSVVIRDAYPKATFHYLVCAKENIPSIRNVKFQNLELLEQMHKVGIALSEKHKEHNFLLGYHAIPSMVRLHLHVISDDFDSTCLKTKKHWNSFTTDFFLQSKNLIKELRESKELNLKTPSEYKVFIDQPLKCHKCQYIPKHLPDLKFHIKTHFKT